MTEFYRFIKSKGYRMRHSLFFPVHILIPLAGIFLYLAYMGLRQAVVWEHLTTYVTLLAMAYPAIAGIVTAMLTDREAKAGKMQNLLAVPGRTKALAAELMLLYLPGLLAVGIAMFGFGAALVLKGEKGVGLGVLFLLVLVLWVSNLPVYVMHLFLGLRFGEGVTIGVGVAESVISAVMLTGLGDGVWYVWWPSYGMRFSTLLIALRQGADRRLWGQMRLGGICYLTVSVLFLVISFVWFQRFEGRREEA